MTSVYSEISIFTSGGIVHLIIRSRPITYRNWHVVLYVARYRSIIQNSSIYAYDQIEYVRIGILHEIDYAHDSLFYVGGPIPCSPEILINFILPAELV